MAVGSGEKSATLTDPTQWVDRYGDIMMNFALARIGRREVAEDLVQETFLAAWKARKSFDGRSKFGTWLLGILRRKIADYFRASGRRPVCRDESAVPVEPAFFNAREKWCEPPTRWQQTPDELVENGEFWAVFTGCLSGMPSHLAQAFELREFGLATMDEICRVAGITPKNLSVRLHRARLLLRQCLERKWFRHHETDG
jgi:RNA polymerase sigma-70 factor (TIGR02943 family)